MTSRRSTVRFEDLWHPFARQVEATAGADAHQFTLYGGYRGPGKSYWLRWYLLRELLRLAKRGVYDAKVGLFCETYPTLTDRQVGPIQREFPEWLGKLRSSQDYGLGFHLHPQYGRGVLALRNLDDPGKYKSAEFAAIGVDQLEQNTKETFDLLRGSLRWPGVAKPRFVATANPGGIGHLWVRQLWLDRSFPTEMRALAEEFAFIEARPDDNPYLDRAYWEMLESLPEGLRQAWRYGNWDIFEGQAFSEWRRDVHVIEPFQIPREWVRFRALDYGYTAPSCVGWFAVDGADWRKLVLYRELYVKGLGPAELAKAILAEEGRESHHKAHETHEGTEGGDAVMARIAYTVADPSIFRVNEQSGTSNATVMAVNGVTCVPGANDRVSGWRMVHEYLRVFQEPVGGEMVNTSRLRVFRTCPNVIRTLPGMVYDAA